MRFQSGGFEERKKWGGMKKGTSVNIAQFDMIKRNHEAVEKLPWKILAGFAVKN